MIALLRTILYPFPDYQTLFSKEWNIFLHTFTNQANPNPTNGSVIHAIMLQSWSAQHFAIDTAHSRLSPTSDPFKLRATNQCSPTILRTKGRIDRCKAESLLTTATGIETGTLLKTYVAGSVVPISLEYVIFLTILAVNHRRKLRFLPFGLPPLPL